MPRNVRPLRPNGIDDLMNKGLRLKIFIDRNQGFPCNGIDDLMEKK